MRVSTLIAGMGLADPAPTPSIQDYTKAVYALETRKAGAVTTKELADRLGFATGSVSAMVARLTELDLLDYEPYRGMRLTRQGRRVALEVLRRHRLLELFLNEELGLSWDEVHQEAEVLEHVLSERLVQAIADHLEDPATDPHGDPIPSSDLEIVEEPTFRLDALEPGARGEFVRVSDSDPEMLRYLADQGIDINDQLQIVGHQPFGGPILVKAHDREVALGRDLAAAMRLRLHRAQ